MNQQTSPNPMEASLGPLNVEQVQAFLPHRYPFLMVDRVLGIYLPPGLDLQRNRPAYAELVGTRSVGIKSVSRNEALFEGHFPGFAVFPGVLIAECIAQVASFCLYPSVWDAPAEFPRRYRFFLAGLDGFRFKKPVHPGDQLKIETEFMKTKGPVCVFTGQVSVDGVKCASGDVIANMFAVPSA